jgi:hypothetical protein
MSSGNVNCWGGISYDLLGTGGAPIRGEGCNDYCTNGAEPVFGLANVTSLTSDGGNDFSCAVLSSTGVDCWGDNSNSELGNGQDGGTPGAPTPVVTYVNN